ncbi:bifunctional metallophosphatase/5'-nucleotidase [Albibacterium bauzanense]|uniref:5'-nucleotidase n=1 Tax=Albibacterium bauzanense TaxID=653929 RepID=A0A4R1LXP0_9SPHI|nr:5'-nucleotidase C-terminal domain-containing protein [Albibacterium bauzanense]TCK83627.1 5'-nucleotidase [Albibacterium bauzanense]
MKLSIGYLNDVHGYLEPHPELFFEGEEKLIRTAGGYARIMTLVKQMKAENPHTLVFDGGDTFHGTLPLIQSKGEAIMPLLKAFGFSAMVGHWDFAYGAEQLLKLQAGMGYPVLGINVYKKDAGLLLDPYIIIETGGLKIGVIGICSNIIDKTMPKEFSDGITVTDGMKELPGAIQAVKKEGADLVFLLSHNGYPQDIKMLSEIPGIDVCLSAHTHNRLFEPTPVGESIIIQCGCHGAFLGKLDLFIDKGKISDYSYQLVPVTDAVAEDLQTKAMIEEIMRPYQQLKEEFVGETTCLLDRYDTLGSSMDDLLLRSVCDAAKTSLAFSNGWRYGSPISPGKLTKWDLYNMVPMNPPVSVVELTGSEIIKMLEENLERTFSADPMLQMGGYVKRAIGISVYLRIENPKGHRIQQLFIGEEPVEKDKTYKAAFITSQGVPENLGRNRADLGVDVVEAITVFLQKHNPYEPLKGSSYQLV